MQPQQALRALKRIWRYHVFFRDWQGERPELASFVNNLPDLTPATLLDGLYSLYARQFGAERWGDKSPTYTISMDLIAKIFPGAQFIHIIRDGRDVALSMIEAYGQRRFFYVNIYYAAGSWKHRVRKALASAARLDPCCYYQLHYEQLIVNPEAALRKICDFLGETYYPTMAEPHKVACNRSRSKGIHAKTTQPVTTSSMGRWRKEMSKEDLHIFQAVAGDLLNELGYGTIETGKMCLSERARFYWLQSKYTLTEAVRRAAVAVGVPHPSGLVRRSWRVV